MSYDLQTFSINVQMIMKQSTNVIIAEANRIYIYLEVNLESKQFKVILPVVGVSSYTPTWKAPAPVVPFSLQVHSPSNPGCHLHPSVPRIIWACLLPSVILLLNVPPELRNRSPFVKYQATRPTGCLHVKLLLLTVC